MPHSRLRFLTKRILKLSKLWPCVGVLGARQTGKTTVMSHFVAKEAGIRSVASFDDEDLRLEAENSGKIFLSKYEPPLLIDEVQKAPKIFDALKLVVDRRRQPGQFFLTGSTQFSARVGIRESLTGRIGLAKLFPMTYAEAHSLDFRPLGNSFLHSQSIRVSSEQIMNSSLLGGMPFPMFLRDPEQRYAFWEGWLETTIYRDLFRVYGKNYDPVLSTRILKEFTQTFKNGELPSLKHFSLPSRKLRKYLEAMEQLFLIRRLPAHPKAEGKDVWMLLDSGLVAHLMRDTKGIASNLSLARHYVQNEILAQAEYSNQTLFHSFFQSAKGNPVDLILEDEKIALKWIATGRNQSGGFGWEERALAGAIKALNLDYGFLVAPIDQIEIPTKKKTIGILPWGYWS